MKKLIQTLLCLFIMFGITTTVYANENTELEYGIILESVQVCPHDLLRLLYGETVAVMAMELSLNDEVYDFEVYDLFVSSMFIRRIMESIKLGKPIYWGAVNIYVCNETDEVTYYHVTCIDEAIADRTGYIDIVPYNRFSTRHLSLQFLRAWDGVSWLAENFTSNGLHASIQADLIQDTGPFHSIQDQSLFNGIISPRGNPGHFREFHLFGNISWTRSTLVSIENTERHGPFTVFN